MRGMEVILEKQFREIVEARLEELGWSRSELARRMDASPQYVTNYLNSYKTPGTDVMERFLLALGLSAKLVVTKKSEKNLAASA